jgi:DNA topoisomerase I
MAKKSNSGKAASGVSLVIVESPAKARTIGKFLGSGFVVEASIGHIRDLPQGAKEIPAELRKEAWSRLGVNVDKSFDPLYIVPSEKKAHVNKLKGLLKEAKDLYLATDEDREGEAISWHLREVLQPKVPIHRLVFHEITKTAIQEALEHPRDIDEDLVRAQETRRILDRLYGYEVSPLLWRKVRPKLSAGRVQSVAVRLIVERERERMKFVSSDWWDLEGLFQKLNSAAQLSTTLISVDGKNIPSGKDFDSSTGKLKNPDDICLLNEAGAQNLIKRLQQSTFKVISVEEKPYTQKPAAPFTTSTLQQEANRKLGFTARRTMQIAQSLYENGHITYMRTDSTNLASVAIDAARNLVRSEYGADFLPDQPRTYVNKVKNAQEAHEAVRPAGTEFELPSILKNTLNVDEYRLFELIWKRTIACQMADAKLRRTTILIEGDNCVFRVSGSVVEFAGFLRAYQEGSDDASASLDAETTLPQVAVGEALKTIALVPKGHTTQPPARYSEAALTKALEEMGIGRPSTYASIIDTIQARDYVFKKGNALVPTWTAFAVSQLLETHLSYLVDYQFTAQLEEDLDSISRGEANNTEYLNKFYFGNGKPGLKTQLADKIDAIDAREVSRIRIGQPDGQEPIVVRVGKYGPFLEQGERRGAIPDGLTPDELTVDKCLELLSQSAAAEEPLGTCPTTGKPIYLKNGRFGPYIQRGMNDDEEKQNASLLKGMTVDQIDLATALKLLLLPRVVGAHPDDKEPITAFNGRFGPYIKWQNETRSLGAEMSPLDVTLEQALELLSQPKQMRKGFGAKAAALKELGPSPITGKSVELRSGRYGLYVTDGVTNASLPKGATAEETTLEQSLVLLAERAAAGPPAKGRRGAKKAAKAATKKAAKKSAKKSAKKKSAKSEE